MGNIVSDTYDQAKEYYDKAKKEAKRAKDRAAAELQRSKDRTAAELQDYRDRVKEEAGREAKQLEKAGKAGGQLYVDIYKIQAQAAMTFGQRLLGGGGAVPGMPPIIMDQGGLGIGDVLGLAGLFRPATEDPADNTAAVEAAAPRTTTTRWTWIAGAAAILAAIIFLIRKNR